MAKESETKQFNIPEALVFGWPFLSTVEYIIDRVPEFQSVSGARKGGKLVTAVEEAQAKAAKAAKPESPAPAAVVVWPTELWRIVVRYLSSEQFQMPKNMLVLAGKATDQIVPLRLYLPHIDAILEAEDPAPKSVDTPAVEEEAKAKADAAA